MHWHFSLFHIFPHAWSSDQLQLAGVGVSRFQGCEASLLRLLILPELVLFS